MTNVLWLAVAGSAAMSLAGCAGSTLPVIFADKTSVGIDISGSEQGVDLSLGFKTRSLSVVPVAVMRKDKDGNVVEVVKMGGEDKDAKNDVIKDSFSTFGNFTVDTGVRGPAAEIGLGRFFATGVAAQKIAKRVGDAMVERAKRQPTAAPAAATPAPAPPL